MLEFRPLRPAERLDGRLLSGHRGDALAAAVDRRRCGLRDLPLDEFLRLQIAGDELKPDDADAAIATGFLICGPDMPDLNRADERRSMVLNEITSTVGSTLLGLQIGCAQCHDHKFEPLSQADFYRLRSCFETAAFLSPGRSEVGGDKKTEKKDAPRVFRELPLLTNHPSRTTHLVAIRGIDETMSVGEYSALAHEHLERMAPGTCKQAFRFAIGKHNAAHRQIVRTWSMLKRQMHEVLCCCWNEAPALVECHTDPA